MMLDGWTWEQMTLKPETGLIINWPQDIHRFFFEKYMEKLRQMRPTIS
jgi:hypothetical protein